MAAVFAATFMLLAPALYNGFPLLYPDSMTYVADGAPVARAIFLHRFSEYYGVRSLLYSLVILPFHRNLSPWPVAFLQCLLAAWVLWLLAKVMLRHGAAWKYLGLICFLTLFSSLGWYAGFIMPDVLGPLVYLSFFLLVFDEGRLTIAERCSLYPIACWGITAHATHFLLAALLLPLLACWSLGNRRRLFGLMQAGALLALAAAAQMALHGYLYGHPSLNGERPPYLLARVIADGPGKLYLERNCAQQPWAVCTRLESLNDDPDEFLWGADGAYNNATEEVQERIRAEEMPLLKAIVRAYPRQQAARSAANFRDQLLAFGLYGFDASPWMEEQFASILIPARAAYRHSRQAHGSLPQEALTSIQWWTIVLSLAMVAALGALFRLRLAPSLWALAATVCLMILGNAALTGVLSVVDDRYGCRVIWLIPLLAAVFLLEAGERLRSAFRLPGAPPRKQL